MPTYEYLCNTCGHRFEKFQRFSEDPIRDCPECGKEVRKVFHASGVVFKGSGWYINDSRGGSKTSSDKAETSNTETTKTETKTESSSSESKSESKSEAAA